MYSVDERLAIYEFGDRIRDKGHLVYQKMGNTYSDPVVALMELANELWEIARGER